MILQKQSVLAESEALMPELKRILNDIEKEKRKGENRLHIVREVGESTVLELRDMGYVVLQTYINGRIDTIVGWKREC